jgi:hypothetical protein
LAKVSIGCKGLINLEENIMFFVQLGFMVTSHRSAYIDIESRSLFNLLAVSIGDVKETLSAMFQQVEETLSAMLLI